MRRLEWLLHQEEGSIREALYELEQELRGNHLARGTRVSVGVARTYSRELVSHVELGNGGAPMITPAAAPSVSLPETEKR